MPAEFATHAGCWLLLPARPDVWRAMAQPAQHALSALAVAIAQFEPVTVGAPAAYYATARRLLPAPIRVVEITSDDVWVRDTGPTFVTHPDGSVRGVQWQFNAWGGSLGGLYTSWEQDSLVAEKILEIERVERYVAPFVLEGGSIHVDGQGTLLTTKECLLNPNRNPHLGQTQLEHLLQDYLNIRHIIWLDQGLVGDETDGHIDNIACFARPGEVILAWTENPTHPQYAVVQAADVALRAARDAAGRTLRIHHLPLPEPMFVTASEAAGVHPSTTAIPRPANAPLTASYVNFYLTNGGVVFPLFDQAQADQQALQTLRTIFPERKLIGVPSRELLLGGGNIHCLTQQQPLGR
jgi:agmatine deiminase